MKSFIVGRVKKRFNETRAYATFERRTQLGSWEIEWYKLRRMNGGGGGILVFRVWYVCNTRVCAT